ncbi:hypothetical protein C7N43_28175 [Sphingobacteriales bacterium UPWRP_1]|nr:hypothetical protein BVG80_18045 [Sphingobacteriales bacterium TSM_CSM]PSJ73621.1 hypothetical protein C7N43_28175 [Sphingobacteriales bacterium UPWRP_1]
MSTRFLLFIALVLWYIFSMYWYVCHIKDHACNCFGQKAGIPHLVIKDGDKEVVNIHDNFKFTHSGAMPTISAPVQAALGTLGSYLQQNPQRSLSITGSYATDETNNTPFNNLGLARANAIKQQLMAQGIPENRMQTESKEVSKLPLFADKTFFGGLDFAMNPFTGNALPPRFLVLDGSKTVVDVSGNFTFAPSGTTPGIPPDVQQALGTLADYLKTNTGKTLTITGSYGNTEKNSTMFDNLGLARADALKQKLVTMGIAADRIQVASQQNNALPQTADKQLTGALNFAIANTAEANLPTFTIKDGSETVVNIKDNLKFALSSDKPVMSADVQNGLATLAQYLKAHPDRRLKITGNYLPDEKNKTKFANLGLARADALKQQLVALGIAATQIDTDAQLNPNLAVSNGMITGGIDWLLQVSEAKKRDLTAQSRTLYFDSGKSSLAMTDELRQYFRDVKTYLEQDPKATVNLTGHTDDVGSNAANQRLGLRRAGEVKTQLTRIGIANKKIATASKGETEPVQSNATAEGKQANRRVEMLVK